VLDWVFEGVLNLFSGLQAFCMSLHTLFVCNKAQNLAHEKLLQQKIMLIQILDVYV